MNAKTMSVRESEIERRWYVVDAADETLGRLASRIARVLEGTQSGVVTADIDLAVALGARAEACGELAGGLSPVSGTMARIEAGQYEIHRRPTDVTTRAALALSCARALTPLWQGQTGK